MRYSILLIPLFALSLLQHTLVLQLLDYPEPLQTLPAVVTEPTSKAMVYTIPIIRVGNLMIIEAKIDSVFGNFVFDTGAQGLVLNRTYFRDFQKVFNTSSGGITGYNNEVFTKRVETLKLGNITMQKKQASVIDLGHIENSKGIKIHGLIGASLLEDFEATIDLRKMVITLYPTDKKGDRITATAHERKADITHPLSYRNQIMFIKAEVGGSSLNFCIDTGAECNVIDQSSRGNVLETISIERRSKLSGSRKQVVDVLYGSMTDFSISNSKLYNMKVVVTDMSAMQKSYGTSIDGMLGFDFFNQGAVTINIKKKQLSISFNKEAKP